MNPQLAMDFVARTLARKTDAATSHAAADRVHEFARSHQELILTALRDFGPSTYHEAAARCGIEPHAAGKRFNELERAGLIRVVVDGMGDELTRPSPSGRKARVWFAC
jgi:predicted ArsR family transcriptional regulator